MEHNECSHEGCVRTVHSKGLCQNHYRQSIREQRGLKKPGPKPDPTKSRSRYNPNASKRSDDEMRVQRVRQVENVRPRGWNATDEHCSQGHPWNDDTVMISSKQRMCRYCSYLSQCRAESRTPMTFEEWTAFRRRRETMCVNGHLWSEHGRKNPKGHWICKKCQIDTRRRALYGIEPESYDAILEKQDGKCAGCLMELSNLTPFHTHIDHHHGTKAIRGILCSNCNMGLGKLMEDPAILRRLADYLDSRSE